jgi:hypothetical protein
MNTKNAHSKSAGREKARLPPGRLYTGNARLARERARTRSTLTRIATLTKQLAGDLNYASDPATQRYWNESQQRRSAWSIKRKKAESLQQIASLPSPYKEELLDLTKAIWRAAVTETPLDWGLPHTPLHRRQAELLAEARAELAPTQRALAEARRLAT